MAGICLCYTKYDDGGVTFHWAERRDEWADDGASEGGWGGRGDRGGGRRTIWSLSTTQTINQFIQPGDQRDWIQLGWNHYTEIGNTLGMNTLYLKPMIHTIGCLNFFTMLLIKVKPCVPCNKYIHILYTGLPIFLVQSTVISYMMSWYGKDYGTPCTYMYTLFCHYYICKYWLI